MLQINTDKEVVKAYLKDKWKSLRDYSYIIYLFIKIKFTKLKAKHFKQQKEEK